MSDLGSRLGKLEDRRNVDMPRLLLVATGDSYTDKGSGRVYSAQEAAELEARGIAQLIQLRTVTKPCLSV